MINKTRKHQSGAVLVISLVMLLLLTLIGITGTQTSSLQEKMAGNMRDKSLAFQAAESAVAVVESSLDPAALTFDDAGTGGYYSQASTIPTTSALMTDTFWTSQPVAISSMTTLDLGNNMDPPLFIVQEMGCMNPPCLGSTVDTYRITVRATGGSPNTVVILQSVYSP